MKLLISICAAAALLSPCGSFAATTSRVASWQALSARTAAAAAERAPETVGVLHVLHMPAPARPLAASSSFIINFVAAGINAGGLPCFDCVNGASGFTFGLPGPFNYVYTNTYQQYNVTWTNISFAGNCKVSVATASGKTKIQSASATVKGITSGLGTYDYAFPLEHPSSYSGPAVLTGEVKCGSETQTTTASLIYE